MRVFLNLVKKTAYKHISWEGIVNITLGQSEETYALEKYFAYLIFQYMEWGVETRQVV